MRIKTAILGASGYTGAELIRLLACHPHIELCSLGAERKAGETIESVFPHLSMLKLPSFTLNEEIDYTNIELVFCALPHGLTQKVIASLPKHLKIVDLSADFRLRDENAYHHWYGHPHFAPDLQKAFVYGLTEFYRTQIAGAQYVANTGCYVACSLLALLPIIQHKAIHLDTIIIDAKSGVSGAGRTLKESSLFTEVSEGFSAYGMGGHRHSAEIDQELSLIAGCKVTPRFTPHLLPQNRGILSTIYVDLAENMTAKGLHHILSEHYEKEYFIRILPFGKVPETRYVRGSNYTMIGVAPDRDPKRAVIVSVLDNLVKGASGQAIQNMNVMFGFPEATGLMQLPLFP